MEINKKAIFFILILKSTLLSPILLAQTITWTGATDNVWHRACNWDLGIIPTCSHDVVVPTVTTYPVVTGLAHSKSISITSNDPNAVTINSSGSGLLEIGSMGGSCSGTPTDSSGCGLPNCTVLQSNATAKNDEGYGMAMNSSGIFLVGGENNDGGLGSEKWRIEKRNPTTGALVAAFGTGGIVNIDPDPSQVGEYARRVTIDASGLYIIGLGFPAGVQKWYIVKLNLTTGATLWSQTSTASFGLPRDIAVDASGVYVVGYENSAGNSGWWIEKRNLSTGALIGAFGTGGVVTVNPTTEFDGAYCITISGSSLFIGGSDNTPSGTNNNSQWRIESRDATTGALNTGFATSGVLTYNVTDVNFDGNTVWEIANDGSYLYLAASGKAGNASCFSVEKRDITTGAQVWTQSPTCGSTGIGGIVVDATGVYAAGTLGQWRLDKYNLNTGAIECTTTSTRYANDIAKSGSNVYVFGTDFDLGVNDFQWRIESQCGCP